jgi:hypothetical protein
VLADPGRAGEGQFVDSGMGDEGLSDAGTIIWTSQAGKAQMARVMSPALLLARAERHARTGLPVTVPLITADPDEVH